MDLPKPTTKNTQPPPPPPPPSATPPPLPTTTKNATPPIQPPPSTTTATKNTPLPPSSTTSKTSQQFPTENHIPFDDALDDLLSGDFDVAGFLPRCQSAVPGASTKASMNITFDWFRSFCEINNVDVRVVEKECSALLAYLNQVAHSARLEVAEVASNNWEHSTKTKEEHYKLIEGWLSETSPPLHFPPPRSRAASVPSSSSSTFPSSFDSYEPMTMPVSHDSTTSLPVSLSASYAPMQVLVPHDSSGSLPVSLSVSAPFFASYQTHTSSSLSPVRFRSPVPYEAPYHKFLYTPPTSSAGFSTGSQPAPSLVRPQNPSYLPPTKKQKTRSDSAPSISRSSSRSLQIRDITDAPASSVPALVQSSDLAPQTESSSFPRVSSQTESSGR